MRKLQNDSEIKKRQKKNEGDRKLKYNYNNKENTRKAKPLIQTTKHNSKHLHNK